MTIAGTISASMEDYLETIFLLVEKEAVARSKDIAKRLNVTRASVTGALQNLAERGLVNYERYGYITLTKEGTDVARDVVRRHEALKTFFINVLDIDAGEADKAACQMEHAIPRRVVDRLIDFADFVETCPRAGSQWVHGFGYQCQEASVSKNTCERCITQCLEDVRKRNEERSEDEMKCSLKDLKPGEKGQINAIKVQGSTKRRIMDMGIVRGSLVEMVRIAPMGDPIDVRIKGYHLSLRKEEASGIIVTRL